MTVEAPGRPSPARMLARATVPLVLVAAAFGLAALSIGLDDVRSALAGIRPQTMLLLLGLAAFNYGARALRWFMLFRAVDRGAGATLGAMPRQVLIYVAGYAFTLTPGRAGEAIRVWMAARDFKTPVDAGVSLVVADRFYDAVALTIILLAGGLLSARAGTTAPLVMVLILVATISILGLAASAPGFWDRLAKRLPKLARAIAGVRRTLAHLSAVSRPARLPLFALPSLAGMAVQGLAPMILLDDMGISIGPVDSVLMFALATLVGGALFLPGGLGGFEATMIGLLSANGVPLATAAIATLVLRVTTLWFGVLLGILALIVWLFRPSRRRGTSR